MIPRHLAGMRRKSFVVLWKTVWCQSMVIDCL